MQKDLTARQCMLLSATTYYLLKEVPGEQHNLTILNFFNEIGHTWVQTDETAWCAAWIAFLAKTNGIEYSRKLDARSWLNIGRNIPNPEQGDLVIFWRGSLTDWRGHVGLYMGHDNENNLIHCFGANQSNQVNIKPYPINRLLGFRRLDFINT